MKREDVKPKERTYTILDNIAEWRRGCTCGGPLDLEGHSESPADCVECTEGLIRAIESAMKKSWWRRIISTWL